jgi:hypothetical protein
MGVSSETAKQSWANPEIRARREAAMAEAGLRRRKNKANGTVVNASVSNTPEINAQVNTQQ